MAPPPQPPPAVALHVVAGAKPASARGAADSDSAPSEPPSPLLRDGGTALELTASDRLGFASASCSPPGSLLGCGAGLCRLARGATAEESADSKRMQRKLIAALCLAFVFMLVEVAGGIYAHSLAIITDAAHLLSDVSGFAVAVLAAIWAKRRASSRFSFGYHRIEVLGALGSVMMVWVITLNLLVEAIHRLIEPQPVNGKVMFIVAVVGVACNVLMMLVLGHHHHGHACSGHGHAHAHHSDSSSSAAAPELGGVCGGAAHPPGCCSGQPHSRHRYAAAPAADVEAGEQVPLSSHGMLQADEGEADYVLSAFLPILGAAGAQPSDAGDPEQRPQQAQQHHERQLLGGSREGSGEGDAARAALQGHACAHDHANMNMRGAIIHVIGDFVQSIGVALAGALIWWHQDDPRWAIADPICTFLFAGLVLWTTKAITADIFAVLMERAPAGMNVELVRGAMAQVRGVHAVEDLHVWSLTPGIPLLCAHVAVAKGADAAAVVRDVERFCRQSLGIQHATIQPAPPGGSSRALESV